MKARDAVIQTMIVVDVVEWDDFFIQIYFLILQCFCNVVIITGYNNNNKKQWGLILKYIYLVLIYFIKL